MPDDALVPTILAAAEERQPACGSSRVIAIDGPSGAGKTDLTAELARASGAAVLHLDDLYPGWRGLEATPPMVADLLASVAVGDIGVAHRWDWEAGRPGSLLTLAPQSLIILDGVGSAASAIRPFLSLIVWLEAPTGVRQQRALARDGDTFAPWWDVWAEQERRHHAREGTRGRADLVIGT